MARFRLVGLMLVAGLLPMGAGVRAEGSEPNPLGPYMAPRGCWTMEGGCGARTGRAETEGIGGPLEPAWSVELSASVGAISSEPRVWQDRVFVSTAKGNRRSIHVLNLGDGRRVAKPLSVKSAYPLEFGIWEDRVLVRTGEATLALYRLHGGAFKKVWEVSARARFHCPVMIETQVLALDGEDIVCWDVVRGEERWRAIGSYRGQLAVAVDYVLAIKTDDVGNLDLVELERGRGRPRSKGGTFLGTYRRPGVPPPGVIAELSDHITSIFVRHHQALRTKSGRPLSTSRVLRRGYGRFDSAGLHAYRYAPVWTGTYWLGVEAGDQGEDVLNLGRPDEKDPTRSRAWPLAGAHEHAAFAREVLPPTVAGATAYVGARAFEVESRRVTWIGDEFSPRFRPVPANEALLIVADARRLTCLREKGARVAGALFLGPAHAFGTKDAPAPVRQPGVVLLTNDAWYEGDFTLDPTGHGLTLYKKKGKREKEVSHKIREVALVLDAEDRVLYTSSFQSMPRILDRWHFHRRADDYYKFAKAAYKTKDWKLMQRLVNEAALRGISDKKLRFPRKQIGMLRDRGARGDGKRTKALKAKIANEAAGDAARTARILESPIADPRWAIQKPLARQLLQMQADHPVATELVRRRMPDYIPIPKPFRALEWIDFVDQVQHTTADRIKPPVRGAPGLTRLQREYGAALVTWRKDLIALQSSELLILTPLASPGRIAGCLSMGALVCEALESVFASGTDIRADPWPLTLRLYENKKEYLGASLDQYASSRERKNMENTVGHFDAQAGVSRIFLPERFDAWKRVMSVYAHELTHHWIAQRCPLFKAAEYKRTGGQAGYWIVEGMATFVEEFHWALEARSWRTANPSAESLDIVANATTEQLIPWKSLYNMPQIIFGRLDREKRDRKVPMRWRLGYKHQATETDMFYAQASATCNYLYHAGPEQRRKLIEYVRAHYTGAMPRRTETVQHSFQMSPDELGRRVLAYAKKLNASR